MKYISKYQFPSDKVKMCKRDVCVEARGKNAELIVSAISLAFICWGISAIIKAG